MEDAAPDPDLLHTEAAAAGIRSALVTGGAQGIGRALVRHLSEAGWRVAALDIDAEALAEVADWPGVLTLTCDIGDEAQVRRAVTQAGFDRIDLLVNNGGPASAHCGPLEDLTLEAWNGWIGTHLTGAFLVTRACLPALRAAHGSVVNMASTRAFQSEPGSYAYAAAKGGLVALTHALAVGLGPEVRANAVAPGWIVTEDWQKLTQRRIPELSAEDHAQHPVGRAGVPSDIVRAVMYLADAGFVTGQVLTVDGGMTRRMIYA